MHATLGLLCCLALMHAVSAQVTSLPSPAGTRSGEPNLTVAPDGRVLLSWIETKGDDHYGLRFAVRTGEGWSEPGTIAEGQDWFVNWADFPSMLVLPDGTFAAHWLVKSGKGTYDYDVHIARSHDDGKTWGEALVPHQDGKHAEHGFVSLFAGSDGALSAVWLDGREMKVSAEGQGKGAMTLRYVEIGADGALANPALLDDRVCECCQTSATMTSRGPVVVYRDRSSSEVRDISIVRRVDGKWTEPRIVCADEWSIAGCPVNGPSVAASGRRVAVAWFTAADNKPRVLLSRSDDAGENFAEPIVIDNASPSGRVELLMRDDGTTLVCWLARADGGGAVRVRAIAPDGTKQPATTIATCGSARSNGFPQMVLMGNELVFAWTDGGVQTATLALELPK